MINLPFGRKISETHYKISSEFLYFCKQMPIGEPMSELKWPLTLKRPMCLTSGDASHCGPFAPRLALFPAAPFSTSHHQQEQTRQLCLACRLHLSFFGTAFISHLLSLNQEASIHCQKASTHHGINDSRKRRRSCCRCRCCRCSFFAVAFAKQ